ncbi:MAG: aminotransferase class III-fold pyridoxal phosphate-dependent enzyme [Candidatus Nanohaloarchaea archaeon]|nr:aminotransferase class III-fold pyridoxal phosphate-dependent enzyme [Candidatus Nanohaloarchaea archaeon]
MLERIREFFRNDTESFHDHRKVLLPTTREEVLITGAQGPYIDVVKDGNQLNDVIDATSQVGTNPLGHRYEPLLEKVRELFSQDSNFPLMTSGQSFYNVYQRTLAETFTDIYPGNLSNGDLKTYYCNSGSEAVERGCLKAAALARGGNSYIGFENAFHGRTSLALSHTNSKGEQTEGFNFLARVLTVPYATHSGGQFHNDPEENAKKALDVLQHRINHEGPDNINSIMIEPLQGEGGYNVPHKMFIQGINEIASEHSIPLIADEIQSSLRTGEWFAIQHFDVQPDMISVAKAFSGGIAPFGASLIKDEYATDQTGKHSGTFGGNAKECFIAQQTIEIIQEHGFLDNAREQGEYLKQQLKELEDYEIVHEVRGKGLFLGIEFRKNGKPAPELRRKILDHLLKEEGILTEGCGNRNDNTAIRFLLPVNIDRGVIDDIVSGVERTVEHFS